MEVSGSCFCGQITYSVSGSLKNARSCHCSRCRKIFGGAASAYAEVADGTFTWTAGQAHLRQYQTADRYSLAFCDKCGSVLVGMLNEKVHGITLGTIDGDPGIEIEMHIHVGSKAPWDHIGGDAPQFREGPGT